MEENEFIPKNAPEKEEKQVNTKKKKEEKKTEEKAPKTPKVKFSLANRIDKKKVKIFVGTALTLTSIYLFIACISYFFTWT